MNLARSIGMTPDAMIDGATAMWRLSLQATSVAR